MPMHGAPESTDTANPRAVNRRYGIHNSTISMAEAEKIT